MGLSIARKPGQSFIINDDLEIVVTQIKGQRVWMTVLGDRKKYQVFRSEIAGDLTAREKLIPVEEADHED